MIDEAQLTTLLRGWNSGERNAEAILMRAMFSTFHALASSRLRRFTHSQLCPGDLVSEAYLRLHWADLECHEPAHFMSTVAQVMRNIIVDHERACVQPSLPGHRAVRAPPADVRDRAPR